MEKKVGSIFLMSEPLSEEVLSLLTVGKLLFFKLKAIVTGNV